MDVFPFYNNYKEFSRHSNFLQTQRKKFYTNHVVLLFTSKNIRLINQETSRTQVNKCTSNNGGECRTLYTLEMRYGLISMHWSNIVNPSIPGKPRGCARFGWTMMKYAFYITTYQSGGEGKVDTQTEVWTERQKNLIR